MTNEFSFFLNLRGLQIYPLYEGKLMSYHLLFGALYIIYSYIFFCLMFGSCRSRSNWARTAQRCSLWHTYPIKCAMDASYGDATNDSAGNSYEHFGLMFLCS